jgi:hypothetical protein
MDANAAADNQSERLKEKQNTNASGFRVCALPVGLAFARGPKRVVPVTVVATVPF